MGIFPVLVLNQVNTTLFALRGFYACNFAVLGVWIPYWPLYMSSLGHRAAAIGLLLSMTLAVKLLGPPLWGPLADRGSRRWVIISASFAACFSSSFFYHGENLTLLLMGTLSFSLFQNAQLSLVEATTLEVIDRDAGQNSQMDYGRIRLWGSWGFILFALGLGVLIDKWGISLVPWTLTLLLISSAIISLALPEAESRPPQPKKSPALFSLPSIRWFYVTALLMQFSHGAYYGFMSLHLEHYGFSRTSIGFLWTIGVVAEVMLFHYSKPLLARFGVAKLLSGSLFLAMLRWSLYTQPPAWSMLLLGQVLHAFTFGAFHLAAVRQTFTMAPHASRSTAQAWYTALSFGLGGGLGILMCGHLYDSMGAEVLFALMAGSSALGILTAYRSSTLFAKEAHYA